MNVFSSLQQAGELFFYRVLRHYLRDCTSVLDVGCGTNSALQHVSLSIRKEGIDAYQKSIVISKKKHIHDHYTVGDVRKLLSYYPPKSFDAVLCIDVIEHLSQREGMRLLKEMELVAKKRIILLTPNGFYHQHALEGNPYQIHKSGWNRPQFTRLGYNTFGLRGLRILRDDHASIKYKPWLFWGSVSFLSEIIFFFVPDVCFDVLAVKDV